MSVLDFLLLPFEFIIVGSLAWCAVMLTRVAVGDIVGAMTRKRFAGDSAIDEGVIVHAGAGPSSQRQQSQNGPFRKALTHGKVFVKSSVTSRSAFLYRPRSHV